MTLQSIHAQDQAVGGRAILPRPTAQRKTDASTRLACRRLTRGWSIIQTGRLPLELPSNVLMREPPVGLLLLRGRERDLLRYLEGPRIRPLGVRLHHRVHRHAGRGKTRFIMARLMPDKATASTVIKLSIYTALSPCARMAPAPGTTVLSPPSTEGCDLLKMATYRANPCPSWQGRQREQERPNQTYPPKDILRKYHRRGSAGHRERNQRLVHATARLPDVQRGVPGGDERLTLQSRTRPRPTPLFHFYIEPGWPSLVGIDVPWDDYGLRP